MATPDWEQECLRLRAEVEQLRQQCALIDWDWSRRTWASPLQDETYRREVWERILRNIHVNDRGCWEWQRNLSPDGYGQISVKRRMTRAHQVALAIHRDGVWSPSLQVDHLCRNRRCCNPSHLELVTPRENTRRGIAPDVAAKRKKSVTHCPQGHAYNEKNTYVNALGHRTCRRCRADRMRASLAAAKESK